MTTDDAFTRLRRAADEAERVLDALADRPLSDRMAAALDVYLTRRRLADAATPATKRANLAEALAPLFADDRPASAQVDAQPEPPSSTTEPDEPEPEPEAAADDDAEADPYAADRLALFGDDA